MVKKPTGLFIVERPELFQQRLKAKVSEGDYVRYDDGNIYIVGAPQRSWLFDPIFVTEAFFIKLGLKRVE